MTSYPTIGRRRLLQAGAALGLGVAGGLAGAVPARAATRDYALRATYDWAEAYFTEHGEAQPDVPNENRGSLAWGQSYILRSYLAMYDAFGDTRYLDLMCRNVDAIMEIRDSERGVTDWRGESLPVWRGGAPYTGGEVDVPGANGTPVLRLRTAQAYADGVTAEVSHESADRFTVVITDTRIDRSDTFTNLTMDATSPDFAVSRIRAASPSVTRATAVDLRSDNSPAMPQGGTYTMTSHYVTFSVHTGMVVAPIAEFCRLVRKNPKLMPRYGSKAAKYLRAIRAAVACHDHEWRQNSEGEGWYVWEKGTPLAFDGCEMPHNQFLALATAQAHLATLVDDGPYHDRAVRMLTAFRNDLEVRGNSYVWKYWWTKGHVYNGYTQADDVSEWTPAYNGARQVEDGSHAAISVEAVLAGFRTGMVFDETDVRRMAATYTDGLMHYDEDGEAHVWYRVDGTANLGLQDLQAPRWVNLAAWDERIFTHAREIFNREQPEPVLGSYLLSTAFLAAHNGR
ncbi:hypothetical protein G1H11_15895 [Phytoactinopolyspora alkaliphila]|uniref:Uncharacterized protein n=1 Tax=Phytoactinopolyspora alkaliphila TaxID=1783498 RepID=A0A6N9YP93_9ACTN|nr:hypothetical protein [Phytoactinopolyspora alkaliphila]NED96792.1 hypothetical protein [Phytoactinopolyspora alkaliphila]